MKGGRVLAALVGLAVSLAVGCGGEPEGIAVVGGRGVGAERFQEWLRLETGEPWQNLDERVTAGLFDQFLDEEVVFAAAQRRGLLDERPQRRRGDVVGQLVVTLCGPAPTPAPAAVAAEVARRAATPAPDRVRARQMVFRTLPAAREARGRLAAGEAWEKVSREASVAPNARSGGNLGVLTRGELPPEVEEVLFALEPGEVSDPVRGPGGYHVFQVLERVPGRRALAGEVRETLAAAAGRRHYEACLARLAAEVGVQVRTERLWFRYDGRYGEGRHGS